MSLSIISDTIVPHAITPNERTICYLYLTILFRTISVGPLEFVLIFCYTITLAFRIAPQPGTSASPRQRSPLQFVFIAYDTITRSFESEQSLVPMHYCINGNISSLFS